MKVGDIYIRNWTTLRPYKIVITEITDTEIMFKYHRSETFSDDDQIYRNTIDKFFSRFNKVSKLEQSLD